eukprot:3483343-Pleurochrysis_carterae.AAC.1
MLDDHLGNFKIAVTSTLATQKGVAQCKLPSYARNSARAGTIVNSMACVVSAEANLFILKPDMIPSSILPRNALQNYEVRSYRWQ